MNRSKKIALVIVTLIGIIVPFSHYLTIIEMFFLLIPFAIIFILTLIYLIASFLSKRIDNRNAFFAFSILPVFIFSQILSVFTVNTIQRIRSNIIISEIENVKSLQGVFPKEFDISLGIEYTKMKNSEYFEIKYSRGFMVTEEYDSEAKNWKSYGWND